MLFDDDTKRPDQLGNVFLPEGKGDYKVVSSGFRSLGSAKEVVVQFRFEDKDKNTFTHWSKINSTNETSRRYGRAEVKVIWEACGLTGAPTEDRVGQMAGNWIKLDVKKTPSTDPTKDGFTSILGAWACAAPVVEEATPTPSATPPPRRKGPFDRSPIEENTPPDGEPRKEEDEIPF